MMRDWRVGWLSRQGGCCSSCAATSPTSTPPALKAAGDPRSQEHLAAQLQRHRPADAVLSEEAKDDPARLAADRVWIIDPLDGTREFGEVPRDDWAVHVALWEDGELVAGAVARPGEGVTLATDEPAGRRRRPAGARSGWLSAAPGRPPS